MHYSFFFEIHEDHLNQDAKNRCVQAEVLVGVMRGSSGFSTDEGVGRSLTMFSLFLIRKLNLQKCHHTRREQATQESPKECHFLCDFMTHDPTIPSHGFEASTSWKLKQMQYR